MHETCVNRTDVPFVSFLQTHQHAVPKFPPCLETIPSETGDIEDISRIAANMLSERDPYTGLHAYRVSIYAQRLAKRRGVGAAEAEEIRIGGLLHDIGKIGFSDPTFNHEREGLTREMSEEIMWHPTMGRTLLEGLRVRGAVLDYVHLHHERVDGKGYPFGLGGNEIPLGALVISVADCFDAMITDRPYQKRKNITEAIQTLESIRGTVLCPELVDCFIEDIEENGPL